MLQDRGKRRIAILGSRHVPVVSIHLVELGVVIGFVAAFLTVVFNVLARVPAVVVSDPFMHEHPDDVHVHVGKGHGHGHVH